MKNLFLVSPVAEFHRWTSELEVTPRNMKILDARFEWVKSILRANGCKTITSLDISEIPFEDGKTTLTTASLAMLFKSQTYQKMQLTKEEETVDWCDAIVLMPECHLVTSSHVNRVSDMATLRGKPIIEAENIVPIDSGDFKKQLSDIERIVSTTRARKKILMKGGRQR